MDLSLFEVDDRLAADMVNLKSAYANSNGNSGFESI